MARPSSGRPTLWRATLPSLARLCLLAAWLLPGVQAWAATQSFTFFEGTQYPLTAVFLQGDLDGPTVMVQGGIQGDEPSGYVTAQVLTHSKVLKGNLIVVPRANVPSINLSQRQVNVDMNRRFDQDYNRFYEDRLARVVRFLLSQSNALIHLHEGSGFYHPTYVDALRNPNRYGQSIIVDALEYGGDIELGDTVRQVLEELNPRITPEAYRFQLFNTETFTANSPLAKEMQKSLTCYALTTLRIPAVAVEVSKDIRQLDWKVMRQLEATLTLLKHFGVEVVPPGFTEQDVRAYQAQAGDIRINGRPLAPGANIDLTQGSPLFVEQHQGGNEFAPSLALFASDRPGVNLLSAPRIPLESFNNLELRLDGRPVVDASVRWTGEMPAPPQGDQPVFVCWLNGHPHFVPEGQSLEAVLGDQLIIEGIWGSERAEILNFKGYVATAAHNDGQDMGWEIILDPDNFLDKYRIKDGPDGVLRYEVVRETKGTAQARMYVDVAPRQVHALRLVDGHGQTLVIPWTPDREYYLPEGGYTFLEAWSNGPSDKVLATVNDRPLSQGQVLTLGGQGARVDLRLATTFEPMGSMTFKISNLASSPLPSLY